MEIETGNGERLATKVRDESSHHGFFTQEGKPLQARERSAMRRRDEASSQQNPSNMICYSGRRWARYGLMTWWTAIYRVLYIYA